jgi:RNA polymerase-interacting CarD/CdnL/TRCF family regulator
VANKQSEFKKGDYLVHSNYGVGQIKKIEFKTIGEDKVKYFTVEGQGSIFYVPTENINPLRVRPIATDYLIRKITKIMKNNADVLPDDHNLRKKYINEIISRTSLEESVALMRDLAVRKHEHKLNDFEETILTKLKNNLILEWSIVKKWDKETTENKIDEVFHKAHKI